MASVEFKLPDIGEGVAEGEITSWKVNPGDEVTEDQIMVEVMTDKATVEIGSPVTGRVVELKADEGEVVPVGNVIVVLEDSAGAGGAAPAATSEPAAKAAAKSEPASEPAAKSASQPESDAAAPTASAAGSAGGGDGGEGLEEVDFALPDIGEGVAEGEITKWLVKEGEEVVEDQPMLEVMTDKATVEIGSPVNGQVLKLLKDEGETVPVGDILLVLGARDGAPKIGGHGHGGGSTAATGSTAAEPAAAAPAASGSSGSSAAPAPATASTATATAPAAAPAAAALADTGLPNRSDGTRRVRAAPAVRRLAREMGVDLATLNGTGPNGRVRMDDVRHAASAPAAAAPTAPASAAPAAPAKSPARAPATAPARPSAPAAAAAPISVPGAPKPHDLPGDRREPLRGLRRKIATQMRTAKHTAAHFTYVEEIDVTELVALRKRSKARAAEDGVKLTFMPFLMKAMVPTLRKFPLLNASLDEETQEIVYHDQINLGIAVDTPAGLIVPVVHDVPGKSVYELSTELAEKAGRARDGKARPEDFGGGTFTITNAGSIGGYFATPVINVPEVAILGVHKIQQRPWVVDGEIVIREIMLLSISLDHRVVDGAVGAYFMNHVKELLEDPALLLVEGA